MEDDNRLTTELIYTKAWQNKEITKLTPTNENTVTDLTIGKDIEAWQIGQYILWV